MGMNSPRDAAAYSAQLRQLLPTGAAWQFGPDSNMARLLSAMAQELARVDGRIADLVGEADPRTTLELLADYERVTGLPDDCFGAPDNVPERQIALTQKLTGLGGQSRAYFIELAAYLGYVVTIKEHRIARIGMRIGDRLNGDDWAFAWTVHVQPFEGDLPNDQFVLATARIGDRIGVRLRGFGAIDLECLIRRHAPAHTHVNFAYEIEPEPLVWADFTQ